MLLIIRPIVASGKFITKPNPCQTISFFFLLRLSLAQKGISAAFAVFWNTWQRQQRENIVTWSGREEIARRNKDGM